MRVLHLSDSHQFHYSYKIPEGIDVVIHSGDATNSKNKYTNEVEMRNFLNWYESVEVPFKIYVAGNHDTSVEAGLISIWEFAERGIIYLKDESTVIDGVKFYGTPYSPTFGTGWAFNKNRNKMHEVWDAVPEDTNVLITHSPPMGVLDLSEDRSYNLEMCGCKNLSKRCRELPNLRLVAFGHIHNQKDIVNTGLRVIGGVTYSNAAGVMDGRFDKGLTFNGNIVEI